MKPREVIESIINTNVARVARELGFKKSRLNFFRRKGTVVQVINIQLSRWNRGDKAECVNDLGQLISKISVD
jgi:hypothetical protein